MEKRESKRKKTQAWEELQARAKIGENSFRFPVVDISIGGIGVLVTDGFSLLHKGTQLEIETLEKKGKVIATSIPGRIAYLGSGYLPAWASTSLPPTPHRGLRPAQRGRSRHRQDHHGQGADPADVRKREEPVPGLRRHAHEYRQKAIPAEFFYLRPEQDNMVLRIVRISDLRLPFQPQIDMDNPFYLFKGADVMLFTARINDIIKNIMETTWPDAVRYISRRSVLRYLMTGDEPLTATLVHPKNSEKVKVFIWDISIEGMVSRCSATRHRSSRA
jgi:hypothetical protein